MNRCSPDMNKGSIHSLKLYWKKCERSNLDFYVVHLCLSAARMLVGALK
jgi:hypothetical protein